MIDASVLGPIYTRGQTFRARAERRQREVRAATAWGWREWGHRLDDDAIAQGKNFIADGTHKAVLARQEEGKGVAPRTFENMLSSQAMCFNLFAPLAADLDLASKVLGRVIDGLAEVTAIDFEHTPPDDVFRDQSALGGVDCDLRIDGRWKDGKPALVTLETKFVETSFSTCAFRDTARLKPDSAGATKPFCPDAVQEPAKECLYRQLKNYAYWERTEQASTLKALPRERCPFGGAEWQLWTNHVLAHALATRANARPRFVVCAPADNDALTSGDILDRFASRLSDPSTFAFVTVERVVEAIQAEVDAADSRHGPWVEGFRRRYIGI